MRLQGQVAWITGAAQGLGEALAYIDSRRKAARDLHSAIFRQSSLTAVAHALHAQHPHCRAIALPCDIRREEEVMRTAEQIAQQFGRLDILIANAGVIHSAELTEMSLEQWQWQIDVNLTGYFLCAREAAKLMKPQGKGGDYPD
jgi:sorbitol-6-phosphate 2-dehydrogenase